MTGNALLQLLAYVAALTLLVKPMGRFLGDVLDGRPTWSSRALGGLERLVLRLSGVRAADEMTWHEYAVAVLVFSAAGIVTTYALQRVQGALPLDPQHLPGVPPALAFDTAVSFITNTNWQAYAGETTMSYLTQMLGLAVHNFLSAATGIAVAAALIRGFARHSAATLGNFWVDVTRVTVHVLLPLSLVLALALVSQGVVQSFRPAATAALLQPVRDAAGHLVTTQTLPLGPAASQIAIKQLGTNGGGFFNANSAHPFENPTPFANFLEMLAILLIPGGLCMTFGRAVGDARQGWAIYAAMLVLLLAMLVPCVLAEQHGNPRLATLGADARATALQPGGNMEGKETRFGITTSALFATVTTAASCGAVNAMHDSFTPLGGLVPLVLIQLGEVVFGGVGSGLYGMLLFVLVAVFVAGLMVGRTPEYVGKKIDAYEMKMASLAILAPPALVLIGSAASVLTAAGRAGIFNPGVHGFSEVLYAWSSAANNNGSAFAGLNADLPWYHFGLALAMFVGRFGVIVPVLAAAGALAAKRAAPAGPGTLPTHTPLFVALLVGIVVVVGALTYLPALALGPIVEHLQLGASAVSAAAAVPR